MYQRSSFASTPRDGQISINFYILGALTTLHKRDAASDLKRKSTRYLVQSRPKIIDGDVHKKLTQLSETAEASVADFLVVNHHTSQLYRSAS